MSASGASKQCPRCNTLLPLEVPFCTTCGLPFSGPASWAGPGAPQTVTSYDPTQPLTEGWGQSMPDAPGQSTSGFPPQSQSGLLASGQTGLPPQPGTLPQSGSPSQAGFAPQGQRGIPPGAPPFGQANYGGPPAPLGAPPAKRANIKLIVILAALVVAVLGGGIAGAAYFLTRSHAPTTAQTTPTPICDRHGLQDNVPLPTTCTFQLTGATTITIAGMTITIDTWVWTVPSPNNPSAVQTFYQKNLPDKGWTHQHSLPESLLSACQSNQVLLVRASTSLQVARKRDATPMTINAPSGGSVLAVGLTSDQKVFFALCNVLH